MMIYPFDNILLSVCYLSAILLRFHPFAIRSGFPPLEEKVEEGIKETEEEGRERKRGAEKKNWKKEAKEEAKEKEKKDKV